MTRTAIRPEIAAVLPKRMLGRPINEKGYPVPWFASKPDGVHYDLRVVDGQRILRAVEKGLCWICGEPLGVNLAFVIGPMCAVNRLSSEPPQHLECAIFAASACPFLTLPKSHRRDANLPEGSVHADGNMVMHNPGACAVWSTRGMHVFRGPRGGILFNLGDPTRILWYCRGRVATHAEVLQALELGLPLLRQAAIDEGGDSVARVEAEIALAMTYLPRATSPNNPAMNAGATPAVAGG